MSIPISYWLIRSIVFRFKKQERKKNDSTGSGVLNQIGVCGCVCMESIFYSNLFNFFLLIKHNQKLDPKKCFFSSIIHA